MTVLNILRSQNEQIAKLATSSSSSSGIPVSSSSFSSFRAAVAHDGNGDDNDVKAKDHEDYHSRSSSSPSPSSSSIHVNSSHHLSPLPSQSLSLSDSGSNPYYFIDFFDAHCSDNILSLETDDMMDSPIYNDVCTFMAYLTYYQSTSHIKSTESFRTILTHYSDQISDDGKFENLALALFDFMKEQRLLNDRMFVRNAMEMQWQKPRKQ
jgi:hypothetical protein